VTASKNWTLNATAAAWKKIQRRRDWSVDYFDSMEIRLGKSAKFDSAGVYQRRKTMIWSDTFDYTNHKQCAI